jgi:hypothetical protein
MGIYHGIFVFWQLLELTPNHHYVIRTYFKQFFSASFGILFVHIVWMVSVLQGFEIWLFVSTLRWQ